MTAVSVLLFLAVFVLGALAFLGGLTCMIIFIVKKCTGSTGGTGLLVTAIVLLSLGLLFMILPILLRFLLPTLLG